MLERGDGWALVLVSADQLDQLARLRYQIHAADDFGLLLKDGAERSEIFAASFRDSVRALADLATLDTQTANTEDAQLDFIQSLAVEQAALASTLSSIDDDADGLTNTQEEWWCTNPELPDTDNDGIADGTEIQALKDWVGNRRAAPPGGTPWPAWPFNDTTCPDKDHDSIPNLAERWELGLNMDWESTDRDKFDDGQEVFGVTYCPGGDLSCGYGDLPRSSDSGYVGANMPAWVKAPGNHPLVAAFPIPEVDVVQSSFRVQVVTTVTTDHVISSGTEKSYSTAKTEGTSTSVADTVTWNEWQEVSESLQSRLTSISKSENQIFAPSSVEWGKIVSGATQIGIGIGAAALTCGGGAFATVTTAGIGALAGYPVCLAGLGAAAGLIGGGISDIGGAFPTDQTQLNVQVNKIRSQTYNQSETNSLIIQSNDVNNFTGSSQGTQYSYDYSGQIMANKLYELSNILASPLHTTTNTSGKSWGGAQTTTHEQYEEHTVTNGEAFSNEESWGNATAVDSAHSADLRFTYKVRNDGKEYARQICNLAFNIYIGDNPDPATTYFVSPDLGGDGCFANFMPDEEHTYTSRAIPLSLDQMREIDLGSPLRVVVEDYTYGADELFYQDAANAGILLAMEDGADDGDETIDTYLIPTWGEETVLDVLARYFPHTLDENDNLTSIWTPEQRADTPAWCNEPQRYGNNLWCKHALSTADWWNIYTNGMGDGTEGFQDTLAVPGQTALFRFNQDSDLDGYSDRSEARLGTDPNDAGDFPRPELLAGMHSIQNGSSVTATLSLLNTGLYDAYGVEAVMVAPDDSISITNNTVGGSGRVRAQRQVVVGSHITLQSPLPAAWTQSGHAIPSASGYYIGAVDRNYTFTASCSNPGGCSVGSDSWSLSWTDGMGGSGSLNFGSGYASPSPQTVDAFGMKVGLLSGMVTNGESFTVTANTPRDTFQYTINREPHAEPLVIVSYNDPQGNHRFIVPPEAMDLGAPTDNLAPFVGEMLPDVGVELVTRQAFTPGANTTDLLVNLPISTTLQGSHLFLEFINITGTVVAEFPYALTVQAGPNVIPLDWDSTAFDPAYNPEEDYIVMAFWTDYEGNILDTAGRPLSSFQEDPRPASAMTPGDETWDFGTAPQGTLMQRQFVLASVGYMDLLTYLGETTGVSLEGPGSAPIAPADTAIYTVTLNTQYLPVGPYLKTIPVRTSDPDAPERVITIQGTVTPMADDAPGGALIRPLDWTVNVTGTHSAGEWITFTHTLGPDAPSLHPVKVYSQDYATLWGMGKHATDFGQGTASYDMFGDGRDGDLVISSNTTDAPIDSSCYGAAGTNSLYATNGLFQPGQKILIHQSSGANVGKWEINQISSYSVGIITTSKPLENPYTDSGASQAQVLVLKQYRNVTVNPGVTWIAKAWDGNSGGILAFLANGTSNINGTISASGKGYSRFGQGDRNGQNGPYLAYFSHFTN